MTMPAPPARGLLAPEVRGGTSFKLIGLGGTGGIVARYLSIFLGSLGRAFRLVFVDGDNFEPGNSARMFYGSYGNKAVVTRADLIERFADSELSLLAIKEYVTAENVSRLIQNHDVVILCVDNHATRKLVAEHCAMLDDVCLVSGGNDGVGEDGSGVVRRGTYGNCQIYIRRGGKDLCPPLSQFHPEIREPGDHSPAEESCTEIIRSAPQLLFANLAVASMILNAVLLYASGELPYSEAAVDIAEGRMAPLSVPPPDLEALRAADTQETGDVGLEKEPAACHDD